MAADKSYVEMMKSFDGLVAEIDKSRQTIALLLSGFVIKAKEFGRDLLCTRDEFLTVLSKYVASKISWGFLFPISPWLTSVAIKPGINKLLCILLGSNYYEDIKSRIDQIQVVENRIVDESTLNV